MLINPENLIKFYSHLYQQHLGELGFLLTQIIEFYQLKDVEWIDLRDDEKRILAHLDALDIGGEVADQNSETLIEIGDDDELLGAIYTLGSLERENNTNLVTVVSAFEKADEELIPFYLLAFKYAKNSSLSGLLLSCLDHEMPLFRASVAEILGYRGDADAHRIWPLFHDEQEIVRISAMVAVMRLGFKEAVPAMEQTVLENKSMFNEHCVFPLLMLGSQKALKFSRLACQSADYVKPQYPSYLALGGNESDLVPIVNAMKFEGMNPAVLEALGILGSLKGVKTLMQFLDSEDDEEKLVAAKSLNQISGAQLYENVQIVEKEEDDIAVEDITGKPAASNEDKQAGDERIIEVKQDCTDKQRWTDWWQQNLARFDASVRYRHGKPYSFFLCLQEIAHPETKYDDRQRAYNELVMRSGHHIPFEPDWFVEKQIAALKEWQQWWVENKTRLTNQWMFDGV